MKVVVVKGRYTNRLVEMMNELSDTIKRFGELKWLDDVKLVLRGDKIGKKRRGLYQKHNNTVLIYGNADYKTFIHELAHALWWNIHKKDRNLFRKYEEIYEHEKVSTYAQKNLAEGFAEAVSYYLLDKVEFKRYYPMTYAYLKHDIGI